MYDSSPEEKAKEPIGNAESDSRSNKWSSSWPLDKKPGKAGPSTSFHRVRRCNAERISGQLFS